jgi:hypothetical protein
MRKRLGLIHGFTVLLCSAGPVSATQFPNATCPDSVTIRQIQDFALCHPSVGDTVRGVGGIIIGFDPIPSAFSTYFQTSDGGPFTGIQFFNAGINTKSPLYNYAIGDSIVVEFATVNEFQSASEVQAPNNSFGSPDFIVRRVSSGNALPPFFLGTTTQLKEPPINTFFEPYEGCLVRINGPLEVARTSLTGGLGQSNSFLLVSPGAPSDSVFVDGSTLTNVAPPSVGTMISSVQGIGNQATRGYRIMLRDANDLGTTTSVGGNVSEMAFRVYPNPARTVRVSFSLPLPEDVEIGIFDVAGRRVATLFEGRLPAGEYSRDWSGRASDGRKVGAGVFFARMKSRGQTSALRMVFLGR